MLVEWRARGRDEHLEELQERAADEVGEKEKGEKEKEKERGSERAKERERER